MNEKTPNIEWSSLNRIEELEALVASLKTQLRAANATIEQYQIQARRSYQDNYDYLSYEENDRE